MSAFPRACCLQRQLLSACRYMHFCPPSKSCRQTRFLSSDSILRASKNKPSLTLTKTPIATPSQVYQTYASRLAQKNHPTLLYLAPPHTAFIFSSYTTAGFCFTYAMVSFWSNYINAPATLSTWVPYAFGAVCFTMALAGGYFLLGPAWIIRKITAMPHPALKAAGTVSPNLAKNATPELQIEVELRKMLPIPFFPARKMSVRPEEIQIRHVLAKPEVKRTALELKAIQMQEVAKKEAALEYERTHIMSAPFRHLSRAFFDLFTGIRRAWTREGFTDIYVKGYRYKLDVSGGWVLESGRALDRLVKIKPRF